MWHDAFEDLWNKLFGSSEALGVNWGFWISLIVVGLLIVLMQGFWFTKKRSTLVREANWAKRELIDLYEERDSIQLKINPLNEEKTLLKEKLGNASENEKASIQSKIDEVDEKLLPLKKQMKAVARKIRHNERAVEKVYKDDSVTVNE